MCLCGMGAFYFLNDDLLLTVMDAYHISAVWLGHLAAMAHGHGFVLVRACQDFIVSLQVAQHYIFPCA